jgi:hypothetical protein
LGAVLFLPLAQWLISTIGWRVTFRILGIAFFPWWGQPTSSCSGGRRCYASSPTQAVPLPDILLRLPQRRPQVPCHPRTPAVGMQRLSNQPHGARSCASRQYGAWCWRGCVPPWGHI